MFFLSHRQVLSTVVKFCRPFHLWKYFIPMKGELKKMKEQNSELQNHFEDLAKKWPSSLVARDQIKVFSGGAISSGRMANLDCIGEGPQRIRIGRKICYPVKSLITWLVGRSESIQPKA